MAQYINKSAVVAEIERIMDEEKESINSFEHHKNESEKQRYNARMALMEHILHFLDTLEVSENPDERMIAKYLYEKKDYPIDLNGHLPSFEETMKDVEKYNKYKEYKSIEKACVNLKKLMYDNLMFQDRLHREEVIDNFVETFKNYMKRE